MVGQYYFSYLVIYFLNYLLIFLFEDSTIKHLIFFFKSCRLLFSIIIRGYGPEHKLKFGSTGHREKHRINSNRVEQDFLNIIIFGWPIRKRQYSLQF